MTQQVDVAIIGAGSAGMRAYRTAIKKTDSIALIEGDQYGTTCARVGCMPSKLLIAPAETAHRTAVMPQFGLDIGTLNINKAAVMKRVRDERDRFVGFVKESVAAYDEKHKIKAYAQFVDDTHLKLSTGDTIEAKTIVIATGSSPFIPQVYQDLGDRVVTSNEIFYWDTLPESVAISGSGIIGLELGQALHRLGVRVRVFSRRETVGPLTDPEVKAYARKTFEDELPFSTNTSVQSAQKVEGGVKLTFKTGDGPVQEETFDYVLAASGRRPNLERLKLENTSLKLDKRGVPEFNRNSMQCGNSNIFIAGDANGEVELLHEAVDEGNIAGENAGQYPTVIQRQRRTPLAIMFSDPQIAMVGLSHKELTEQNRNFVTAAADFEDQGRSRVMLVNKGLMNLYGDPDTGKLLGAEMIGPSHEHLAHQLAWCMQLDLTVAEMLHLPYYHPTIEEGMEDGLTDLLFKMKRGPVPPLPALTLAGSHSD